MIMERMIMTARRIAVIGAGPVGPDVTAPIITSANAVSNPENTVLAYTLTANEPVTWAIVAGGADNARFQLSGSTLQWFSNGTKDFEAPNDANADNAYIVTVRATDLASNPSVTQTITVTVTDVTGVAPAAPVLLLTSGTTDTTPDFTLTGDLAAADVVRFQYANNSSFTGATDITHTITAPEDAANSFSFSTGALANGTWYFRARIERPSAEGAGISGYSNTVSETIATAAYSGPGDITAGALCWYGLRAYSAATVGTNCVAITRAVGSPPTQTFVTLSTGVVDIASITTFLSGTTGKVSTWYDQSGNGIDLSSTPPGADDDCNFTLGALGSLPGVSPVGVGELISTTTLSGARAQPYTMVAVAKRTSGGQSSIITTDTTQEMLFGSSASTVGFYAGTGIVHTVAATDGTVHDVICEINGASSIITVDGSDTTGVNAGTSTGLASGATFSFPTNLSGGLTGVVFEGGFWPGTVNRAALSANMRTYYGL